MRNAVKNTFFIELPLKKGNWDMQIIKRENPIIERERNVRLTAQLKMFVVFLSCFQIFFLSGYIFPVSHVHAADEKSISHDKNSSPSPGVHKDKANTIRDELELISGYAEDIFDLAKADRWKKASKKLLILERGEKNLINTANGFAGDNLSALTKSSSDLERAINTKNRQEAMTAANKITAITALLAKPFKQRVPTNVMLLGFYGRELVIWSEMKNTNKLSAIVSKMHLTWQTLMPLLLAEGGSKDVKKFGEIMKRLEAAKIPEEYGRLAISVLDEVDNLEKVFTQKSSRTE